MIMFVVNLDDFSGYNRPPINKPVPRTPTYIVFYRQYLALCNKIILPKPFCQDVCKIPTRAPCPFIFYIWVYRYPRQRKYLFIRIFIRQRRRLRRCRRLCGGDFGRAFRRQYRRFRYCRGWARSVLHGLLIIAARQSKYHSKYKDQRSCFFHNITPLCPARAGRGQYNCRYLALCGVSKQRGYLLGSCKVFIVIYKVVFLCKCRHIQLITCRIDKVIRVKRFGYLVI